MVSGSLKRRSALVPVLGIALVAGGGPASMEGLAAQTADADPFVDTGQVTVGGHPVKYRIQNLPVSSFPDLPDPVGKALTARGCVIPQTYEAHRPENVVHASLERAGSRDWAVLCSVQGQVSLLVFFADASPAQPEVLATMKATDRLQPRDVSGELGFNWGIDPAPPKRIHDAQAGMTHRPEPPDHDSLADSVIDHRTVYHLFRGGAWEQVAVE